MDKILTIVIPTYNMEKYLDKCLTSLLFNDKDLLKQLEVLVVIDGSKDRSSLIAHSYEKKYPETFRVIDKENGNYGSCINRGLKEATGKYIKILDADDSFDTNNLRSFILFIKDYDVDLILNDFVMVDENDITTRSFSFNLKPLELLNSHDLFENDVFTIQMHGVTYKRENLISLGYTQTEGISYTDQEWVFTPMTKVKTGIYYNKSLYRYLIGREGQTVDKAVLKKQSNQLGIVLSSLLERYNNNNDLFYKPYMINQLKIQLYIYYKALIENSFDLQVLKNIDIQIKEKCPELFNITDKISSCKINYVRLWRKRKYNVLPFYIKAIIKFRNSFFSN